MSAMFLEKYSKDHSSKRTHHINIKYFVISDCLRREELETEYFLTDEMNADFVSKPLQGRKFIKFWNRLMNIKTPCKQ